MYNEILWYKLTSEMCKSLTINSTDITVDHYRSFMFKKLCVSSQFIHEIKGNEKMGTREKEKERLLNVA